MRRCCDAIGSNASRCMRPLQECGPPRWCAGKAFSIGGPFVTSRRNTARYHSRIMAVKKVLVPIAHGSEEIEAVCIIDVLRRSSADVTVASVEDTLQVGWLPLWVSGTHHAPWDKVARVPVPAG